MGKRMTKFLIFILAIAVLAILVWFASKTRQIKVTIYFVDIANEKVVPHEVRLPNPKLNPMLTMQHLVDYLVNPVGGSFISTLPSGTKVRDLKFEGNTIVVDFNSNFLDPQHWSGSEIAYLRLQALVHSLASVYGINRVKILVNGKNPGSLGGHEDLSEPIEPDPSVLSRSEPKK